MAAINPYWEKPVKPTAPASPLPSYFDPTGVGPGSPAFPSAPKGPALPTKTTDPTPKGTTPPVPDDPQKKKIGKGLLGLIGLFSPLLHDLIQKSQNDDTLEDIQSQIDELGNVVPDEKITTEDFFGNPDIPIEIQQQVADALGVTIEEALDLYAGYPIVTGHFDPVTGEFVLGDIYTMVKRLKELADLSSSVPTLDEWQERQGYDLAGIEGKMGDLADLMAGGMNPEDDAAARQWQAENMGFEDFDAYQAYLQGQIGRSTADMTEQEQADWARATEIGVRQIREDKMSMIESMGMSSAGRMYREMDQVSLGMADQRAAREAQRLEYEMAQQQVAFQQYLAMADMGTGQQAQFHELAFQNRMGALQAYSQQATMIMQQYGTELEGMQIHANMMYQSIMADMGYEQFITDQIMAAYELEMAPLLTELELMLTQYELDTSNQFSYLELALQLLPSILG